MALFAKLLCSKRKTNTYLVGTRVFNQRNMTRELNYENEVAANDLQIIILVAQEAVYRMPKGVKWLCCVLGQALIGQ